VTSPSGRDLRSAVRAASARLADAGVPSPEADAVTLAAHVLATSVAQVRKAMLLGAPEPDGYDALVSERVARVPLQHLTGRAGFRRLDLWVGPGVFVPRPETEFVAGLAIDAARRLPAPVVVDLCTGSAAIALAVADEVPGAVVHAVELDEQAHAWAQRNLDATGLAVHLCLADATGAFPELEGAVDVVVSNPPYIPEGMVPLDPEVRDHDPALALYGGSADGLRIPLAVAARAAELLRPGALLVMEHAETQGESLPVALRRTGRWEDVTDHDDLTGRPRAVTARRTADPAN
jgi:release factor glutamine methyltransferase